MGLPRADDSLPVDGRLQLLLRVTGFDVSPRSGDRVGGDFFQESGVKELGGVKTNVWGKGLRQKEDKLMDRKTGFRGHKDRYLKT